MPARRNTVKEITLSDGTKVTAVLKGDESGHWWETESGQCLLIDDDGNVTELTDLQAISLRTTTASRRVNSNVRRASRLQGAARTKSNFVGNKKGLVILVNFQDLSMVTSKEYFQRQFNEEGFSENNHIGSVRDYFSDQSYGKLNIDFDIVGPVTVSQKYSYYGQNSNGADKYPCTMVAEACKLVDSQVDFSQYDWDGDGEVDQVYLLYAGYGESAGAPANTIWPHEWQLSSGAYYGDGSGALTLDGVKINTYAVSSELADTEGDTPDGIGAACHEFSHCLGFPDFYDTGTVGKSWGMQFWDLLDYGSYNGPNVYGEVPCGYTSYERMIAGWLDPTELTPGMTVESQQSLADTPEAYILYNDSNPNEYYLLENRQASRWFSYVGDYAAPSGLLVVHVDYDKNAWYYNTVNVDNTHQRMAVIQANNKLGTWNSLYNKYITTASEYSGHVYPYNTNDSLTNNSVPAATLYNANTDGSYYMNKGIYNITRNSDGTISYTCRESTTSGGDSGDGDNVFYESFDKCSGTGGNDNKWSGNIGSAVFKADNDGWESIKKYGANKCAKFGNTSNRGIATSPSFNLYGDITGTGKTTIRFEALNRFFLDEVKVTKKQADGIKEIKANTITNGHVYSITGQDMGTDPDAIPAGIYIYNGKKYFKK